MQVVSDLVAMQQYTCHQAFDSQNMSSQLNLPHCKDEQEKYLETELTYAKFQVWVFQSLGLNVSHILSSNKFAKDSQHRFLFGKD